ncbi:MAG: hypothetical protein BWY52_02631 [Chloroflexi bacterium ADurb.Bin325]|nr:MAG: hypothetical protein BWY52_02631 [Chloroflexi bacterium ADurb.Bin325]
MSDTARPPLTLSALPRLSAQPRVSAEPRVSAQPTVSAVPRVSAQPTVADVPCDDEAVTPLDPPWLALWLVPPLTPELVESAEPELTALVEPALMLIPLECETLSAVPALCEVPLVDDSAWLNPVEADSPALQPWL